VVIHVDIYTKKTLTWVSNYPITTPPYTYLVSPSSLPPPGLTANVGSSTHHKRKHTEDEQTQEGEKRPGEKGAAYMDSTAHTRPRTKIDRKSHVRLGRFQY
jgi:hypothetical protein